MTALDPARPTYRVVHMDRSSRFGLILFSVCLVGCIAAPFWGGRQTMRLLCELFSYIALASLWNLLAGYAGLVSVGQQAFVGIGGYSLFLVGLWAEMNPLIGVPVAGVVAVLAAVPIALLLFRLRGPYFTIGSWVIAEIFQQVFLQVDAVGGGSGISLPAAIVRMIAANRNTRESLVYWIVLGMMVVILALIVLLLRSRWGLALTAIRDNELAAVSNGIDVKLTRLIVFVIAAFGTSMIGAMIFLQKMTITPVSGFSMNNWTVNVIFMTVIGGIGRVEGPIIGAVIFFILREMLSDLGSAYLIMLGLVAIIVMLWAPKGIWGYLADRYGWQLFPLSRHLEIRPPRVAATEQRPVK
jgi:branched-chain amino acid transport system permease protein